jgi:hypothetical protein
MTESSPRVVPRCQYLLSIDEPCIGMLHVMRPPSRLGRQVGNWPLMQAKPCGADLLCRQQKLVKPFIHSKFSLIGRFQPLIRLSPMRPLLSSNLSQNRFARGELYVIIQRIVRRLVCCERRERESVTIQRLR